MHSFEVHLLWTRSTIIISYNFPSILFSTSATQVEKIPFPKYFDEQISSKDNFLEVICFGYYARKYVFSMFSQGLNWFLKSVYTIREFENTISIKIKRIRV